MFKKGIADLLDEVGSLLNTQITESNQFINFFTYDDFYCLNWIANCLSLAFHHNKETRVFNA